MSEALFASLRNGQAFRLKDVPDLPLGELQASIIRGVHEGQRLVCLCADEELRIFAVLADDAAGCLRMACTHLDALRFPSITPQCPQAHLFEREMAEQYGLVPEGHPWLKPLRFHASWVPGRDAWGRTQNPEAGVMDFYRVEGEGIHEVAVGPVHAGVIEPGHFRFQCHGETVHHLEIALGYQHRGLEKAMLGGPHLLSLKLAETVAGDSSIAHAWAYCQLVEALGGLEVPSRSQWIRGVALELERAANHTGDLGAMAGDVGFLPTASYCGRLRGDWLNMSAEICGSRLGRDWLRPGGLGRDLKPEVAWRLIPRLSRIWKDTQDSVELLWGAASVLNRFEVAGRLDPVQARELGLVGVAARACGLDLDVRKDHPYGPYGKHPVGTGKALSGSVHSRAWVRWQELAESSTFLAKSFEELTELSPDPKPFRTPALAARSGCVALTEGWRGEVLHFAITDAEGRFARYKIVDPSFHNWPGLALALRGEQISDFPLCNKSFNLSYCGHDL
jgi:Ni,Fe-hydrogenase III large subunit